MSTDMTKINCILEGDRATDFEQLLMVLKVSQYANTRQKQHSIIVGAAMLVLDATRLKYTESTGKRYPTLIELLEFSGIAQNDIKKLLNLSELSEEGDITALASAINSSK